MVGGGTGQLPLTRPRGRGGVKTREGHRLWSRRRWTPAGEGQRRRCRGGGYRLGRGAGDNFWGLFSTHLCLALS